MLLLLSLIWGASFLFARVAVLEIPPLTLVLLRVGLAAAALNLILLFMNNGSAGSLKLWGSFMIMGLLNNIIPFSLIFLGQKEIGAGLAAIVNAMTPIWTLLIAHVMTSDERLTTNKSFGIALAFIGITVLIGWAAFEGFKGAVYGQIAVLGATVSYGVASVFGRRFADVAPIETARGQLTTSTVVMLPICLLIDQPWTLSWPSTSAVWSVILLALVSTAFAYILFFQILARAGALNIALVTFLIPPSAILLGILILGETLAIRHGVGLVLILGGLTFIDGRLVKRFTNRKTAGDNAIK